jgi:hypothetical protein
VRKLGLLAVMAVGAVALHILMDLMPHFNWVAHAPLLVGKVRHGWYYPEALFFLPVAVVLLILGRRHFVFVFLVIGIGLYPDLEKIAHLGVGLPKRYLLFEWHSEMISSEAYGMSRLVTGSFDGLLLVVCTIGVWRLNRGPRSEPQCPS